MLLLQYKGPVYTDDIQTLYHMGGGGGQKDANATVQRSISTEDIQITHHN
jgi:hypothetical protein